MAEGPRWSNQQPPLLTYPPNPVLRVSCCLRQTSSFESSSPRPFLFRIALIRLGEVSKEAPFRELPYHPPGGRDPPLSSESTGQIWSA